VRYCRRRTFPTPRSSTWPATSGTRCESGTFAIYTEVVRLPNAAAAAGVAAPRNSYNVRENAGSAQLKVRSKMDNVAGVQLPIFESYSEGADVFELTGLGRGGQQVQHCKKTYKNAVQLLAELATLQVRLRAARAARLRPSRASVDSRADSGIHLLPSGPHTDVVPHPRRGHQDDEPACQRH